MPVFSALVGLLILLVIILLFKLTFSLAWKLLVNSLVGVILLFLFNSVASFLTLGVNIEITPLNAILTGVLGVPYLIFRLIVSLVF